MRFGRMVTASTLVNQSGGQSSLEDQVSVVFARRLLQENTKKRTIVKSVIIGPFFS